MALEKLGQSGLYWNSAVTPTASRSFRIRSCSRRISSERTLDQITMGGSPRPPG